MSMQKQTGHPMSGCVADGVGRCRPNKSGAKFNQLHYSYRVYANLVPVLQLFLIALLKLASWVNNS